MGRLLVIMRLSLMGKKWGSPIYFIQFFFEAKVSYLAMAGLKRAMLGVFVR